MKRSVLLACSETGANTTDVHRDLKAQVRRVVDLYGNIERKADGSIIPHLPPVRDVLFVIDDRRDISVVSFQRALTQKAHKHSFPGDSKSAQADLPCPPGTTVGS